MKLKNKLISVFAFALFILSAAAFTACGNNKCTGEHTYYYDAAAGETRCVNGDSTLPLRFEFDEFNATASCAGLKEGFTGTAVEIPAGVEKGKNGEMYNVTAIGYGAFAGSKLSGIAVPDFIVDIGANAFSDCASLAEVTFGENSKVTQIQSGTFAGTGISSFTAPKGLTGISDNAFKGCSELKTAALGSNITSIGNYAFDGCVKLEAADIPSGVTDIGIAAFRNCAALCRVTFGEDIRITTLASEVFAGCAITDFAVPESVTSVLYSAFRDCASLTKINIPLGVSKLGGYAFNGCASLESIEYGGALSGWTTLVKGVEAWNSDGHELTVKPIVGASRKYVGTVQQ